MGHLLRNTALPWKPLKEAPLPKANNLGPTLLHVA